MLSELQKVFGSRIKALEIMYLLEDLKPVARQGFYDNEMRLVKEFCSKNKLFVEVSPYKVVVADPEKAYSNKGIKANADDPRRGMFFAYISKNEDKAAIANALELKNDIKGLGLILGYPSCCVDFFVKNEPVRSRMDNDYILPALENSHELSYPFFTNLLRREEDAALLSHFPCSFNCKKSVEIGKKNFRILSAVEPNTAMKLANALKGRFRIGSRTVEFC